MINWVGKKAEVTTPRPRESWFVQPASAEVEPGEIYFTQGEKAMEIAVLTVGKVILVRHQEPWETPRQKPKKGLTPT